MAGFFSEIQNAELSTQASFVVYKERSRGMQKEEETSLGFFLSTAIYCEPAASLFLHITQGNLCFIWSIFYLFSLYLSISFSMYLIYFKPSFTLATIVF